MTKFKFNIDLSKGNISEICNITAERSEELKTKFAFVIKNGIERRESNYLVVYQEILNLAEDENELVFLTIMFEKFLNQVPIQAQANPQEFAGYNKNLNIN